MERWSRVFLLSFILILGLGMRADAEEIGDEGKERDRLWNNRTERTLVTGEMEAMASEILYEGIAYDDAIPEKASVSVKDEREGRSGERFFAELSLDSVEYSNERWTDDFEFTATFHLYGSETYLLGGLEIPYDSDRPRFEGAEAELLSLIGQNEENCRIEGYQWSNGVYEDVEGNVCRDALVFGERKIVDCKAVYGGDVRTPDYYMYRTEDADGNETGETATMEAASPAEAAVRTMSLADGMEDILDELPEEDTWWERVVKIARIVLQVSVSLIGMILLVLGLRFLIIIAKKRRD